MIAPQFDTAVEETKLDIARRFTKAYKDHLDAHVAIREGMCLKEYFPSACMDIGDEDLIAGKLYYHPLVGFGLEQVFNDDIDAITKDDTPEGKLSEKTRFLRDRLGWSNCGFVFDYSTLVKLRDRLEPDSAGYRELQDLIRFWMEESSRSKYNRALTREMKDNLGRSTALDLRLANGFFRLCCYSLDYDRLLQLGIPGLRLLVQTQREQSLKIEGDVGFYDGLLIALDVLVSICRHYELQAAEMARHATSESRKRELSRMTAALHAIQHSRPRSLREAIQLFWLYNLVTDTPNYGRMDVYLGDFYANDIDTGALTEPEAHALLKALWKLIADIRHTGFTTVSNARIIVGGKGRRNEKNADRFALAAMDASNATRTCEPNLTLRFHTAQNPLLMQRAIDLIGDGCVHPSLYNDDAHIPMVQRAYDVPLQDAEQYLPEGCGELLIDHKAVGSPNNIMNFLQALDLVLHNGIDTDLDEQRGLALGPPAAFDTFDKLLDALKKQLAFTVGVLARRHALENKVHSTAAAYLFVSMLSDDCIERGKSLFDSGARYLGGIIETFGLTNLVDSLYAIKHLVYEKRVFSLEQMVAMLDANFDGYDDERMMMEHLPKFGNDNDEVDELYRELNSSLCRITYDSARGAGLHFFLNCNLNPGAEYYKHHTKASADGRMRAQAMAYGNAPTAGHDKSGLTALLNSMAKNEALHAGYVQNLKVSKDLFIADNRAKFESLLSAYFESGGYQVMITALNRDDLENAMKEPEKHSHLIVRIAGITMRFVELSPAMQREVITRTFYS
jgi:pyruvate-formate lyase